jgi:ADP-ribose pyrophosphatase
MGSTVFRRKIKSLNTKKIYNGTISLKLSTFVKNNETIEEEIVEHPPSVGMIPLTDNMDVLLVSQYRYAIGKTMLEIPAGKIEKGEIPERAALREMAEEIGYSGNVVPLLKMYLAPGYDTELMYVFVARNLKRIRRAAGDDDEDISLKRIRFNTAVEKCLNGELEDSKTIAAILALARIMSENKEPRTL